MLRAVFALGLAMTAVIDGAEAADVASPPPRYQMRPAPVDDAPDLLFTPTAPTIRILPPMGPLLPGRSTLPGYYGSAHSYEYQGPYYGGPNPNPSYWNRLPYACGVYGYC